MSLKAMKMNKLKPYATIMDGKNILKVGKNETILFADGGKP